MKSSAGDFPRSEVSSLIELLQRRALRQPEQRAYTFLVDGEDEEAHLTYRSLDRQARAIAASLQSLGLTGERALLLYPPGLEYIAGFFGCLYAGVIAVPAYPPDPARLDRTLPRLQTMVADAEATVVLTTAPIVSMAEVLFYQAPDLEALRWLAADTIDDKKGHDWQMPEVDQDTLAFVQYTSGSTRTPRGVMLSHGNLLHNLALVSQAFQVTANDKAVIWLPPYHDMGLIGGIMQPVYAGITCALMSPVAFLQQPFRWLDAVSRLGATVSGGPNFAYDLCVRKITPEQRATLDLSRWSVAFNGSEPVRPETLDRFAETFAPCGFRREAFYPCYGLAEGTLIVSGGVRTELPVVREFHDMALEQDRVVPVGAEDEAAQVLVGCGQNLPEQEIVIVDPDSQMLCSPNQVGEIWISGPSIARGYWNQPDETEKTFGAYLADAEEGPFLRTGDLGFLDDDGELFVTGRLKDLIIVRGRNHYPQDIEYTVERSHEALRWGCGAAFAVDVEGKEKLVVVQEVYTNRPWTAESVVGAIRQAVAEAHELQAHAVVLIEPRTIPKTSSGKIQRRACRAMYLDGTLEVVASSVWAEADEKTQQQHAPESLLVKALQTMAPEQRQSLLETHLQEVVARVLNVPASQLNLSQPLSNLGLDSVMTVDLAGEIESMIGVALELDEVFQGLTLSQLASQLLDGLTSSLPTDAPSVSEGTIVEYPLSYGQRALWFLHQLAPESAAYNLVHAARIRADLDVATFCRIFQRIVDRHPVLRTTFLERDGEPVQRVHPHRDVFCDMVDASTWTEAQLNARLAKEVYKPFDLERGPLMRVNVFSLSRTEHIALLALHHSVTDLWSLALILYELGELYEAYQKGVSPSLKEARDEYADYVRWQRELLAGPEGERLWNYWREQLSGKLPVLDMPTDRPRPPVQSYRGATCTLRLDPELVQSLKGLAKAYHTNLFTLMLAALQVLFHRYTDQEDILVGTPKAGRSRKLARTQGYFVNSVVIRGNAAGDPSFSSFVDQIHETVQGAFEHDAYPFPLLVEKLQPDRDPSRSPLFQVMFAWQKTTKLVDSQGISSFALNEDRGEMDLGGLSLEPLVLEHRVVPFDLTLLMAEAGDELGASMEYNTDLFDYETIERMLGHFERMLEGIVADPEQPISALPLLTDAERHKLLHEWNLTEIVARPYRSIPRLFEAQVDERPKDVAVLLESEKLTYTDLNRRANRLAHYLHDELGVGSGDIVALLMERSIEAIVGFLGVLKTGGAYLPLDPTYPQERLEFMLEDADVSVLLTQSHLKEKISKWANQQVTHHATHAMICLDSDWPTIAQEPETNSTNVVAPDSPAYVIYTSGSTGVPKGVVVSHDTIAHHCRDIRERFELTADDRVLQFASYVFDQSVEQILTTLITGATLVLRGPEVWPPADFTRVVAEFGLTVINLPPAYWHQWVQDWDESGAQVPQDQLRLVIIGGDVLLPETLRLWRETPMRSARLLNAYGPTETTVTALTYDVPAEWDGGRVPIGRPPANRTIYVLDAGGEPVPIGVPGELYLGGVGVAQGYLNRPALTAESFIDDPFSENSRARLYRTGDLTRFLPDSNVEFMGRVDQQVKIRGFRIELGEIETVLNRHPEVRETAVVARTDTPGDKRLVAYLVAAGEKTPDVSEMRDFVGGILPDYMVPSAFMWLASLPLTTSGKVDRGALPEPDPDQLDLAETFVAPRSAIEQELAQMWAEVLTAERVGVHDNFFAIGGHSLIATQLISRVRADFQVDLPLRRLFETPTVAGLANLIEEGLLEQASERELNELLDELERL